ncbi:MAG: hypothetical protein E3J56_15865 [Candidatus Aminicenantes bacterium]|nr:MAG: hypothetical protein E3J56_15865 [Candidatus Aminicenantes bacterium]
MAKSFNKTYSIELKFNYEDNADITDADLHTAELRTKIKEWIAEVIHIQQGKLSVHIVGSVSEV